MFIFWKVNVYSSPIKVGSDPMMRLRGSLVPAVDSKRLDHEDVVAMSAAIMSTAQRQKFKDAQEVDLAYSVPGLGRFRCNVFQQRGTVGLVLRVIPMQIRTIDELGEEDYLSIVLFNHESSIYRQSAPVTNRAELKAAIDQIQVSGSTVQPRLQPRMAWLPSTPTV